MDTIKVLVAFSENTKHGQYNDALYFDYDDYPNITQDKIDALKQERIDNWVAHLDNPPTPQEPTKEELEAQKAELEKQVQALQDQIAAFPLGG